MGTEDPSKNPIGSNTNGLELFRKLHEARERGLVPTRDAEWQLRQEEARAAQIQNDDTESFVKLRTKWARTIGWTLVLTVLFQGYFIVAVGRGWLTYDSNQYFLNVVVTELLIQIVSLAFVIVKCLFPVKK